MTQLKDLTDIIDELNVLNTPEGVANPNEGMPDFFTASNGRTCYFNAKVKKALERFCNTMLANRPENTIKVEFVSLFNTAQQVVVEFYTTDRFALEPIDKTLVKALKEAVEATLASQRKPHTHYFPAWTLGFDRKAPLQVGPAVIMNRFDWLDAVDFSEGAKEHIFGAPEANHRWKELLKASLAQPKSEDGLDGLAGMLYRVVRESPSFVKVTVSGYERAFSTKLASIVAKSALDSLSLALGSQDAFLQQALEQERLPPLLSHSLLETDGFLWAPGVSLSRRFGQLPPERVDKIWSQIAPVVDAAGAALRALVSPSAHPHPRLAQRWTTALDWFAEGNRESNDAIAVAKIATSLDVLSAGGKNTGICALVCHVLACKQDAVAVPSDTTLTIKKLVADIYDGGRSQILHGTHYDRLKPFGRLREYARVLAGHVLRECVLQLQAYQGKDLETGFTDIPRQTLPKPKQTT